MLSVEGRDAELRKVCDVDTYTSLTMLENWMAPGVWVLELPTGSTEVSELLAPGAGIIVRDGATILFSGPADTGPGGLGVMRRELATTETDETDTTTITGADGMVWLADRLAHPSPVDGNPATQGYDVRTGPATSVLWGYINDNAGPGAVVERRVAHLVMDADPATGPTITVQARWQNLLAWLHDLAVLGGVTVTVAQVARQLVATVTPTADLSAGVILSPAYGDVSDVVYEVTRSTATAIYMGAQGDLESRTIGQASIPGVRRVEAFMDRRDVADPVQVAALVDAALVDATGTTSLMITPSDRDSYRYNIDYHLGDLVGVDLGSVRVTARVTQVKTVLTVAGMVRTIGIGDITAPLAPIYQAIRALGGRINQLERI